MSSDEFNDKVVESIINEEAAFDIRVQGPPPAANNNRPPSPEQLRQQLRVIDGDLSQRDRQAVRQALDNPSLWKRLGAWGAKTGGRHAGATVASSITGPAAPAVATIANLALLGYDVYTLGNEIWNWAKGDDVNLPRADSEAFQDDVPINAPPFPNSENSNLSGRNLRSSQLNWNRLYRNTHTKDGSPIRNLETDSIVNQPELTPEPNAPAPSATTNAPSQPRFSGNVETTPTIVPGNFVPIRINQPPDIGTPQQQDAPPAADNRIADPRTGEISNTLPDTSLDGLAVTRIEPDTAKNQNRDNKNNRNRNRNRRRPGADLNRGSFEPTDWQAIQLYDPLQLRRSEQYLTNK